MNETIKNIIIPLVFVALGLMAGIPMGKVHVFERIMGDKIECAIKVNPTTAGVIGG